MVKKNPASENLGANIKLLGDLAWYVKRLYYNFLVEPGVWPGGGLCVGTLGAYKWGRNLAHLWNYRIASFCKGSGSSRWSFEITAGAGATEGTKCLEWENDRSVFKWEARGWDGQTHCETSGTFLIQSDRKVGLSTIFETLNPDTWRELNNVHTQPLLYRWGIWKWHARPVVAPGSPTPPYCSFSHRSKMCIPLNAHFFSHLLTGTGKLWDGRNGEQMSNTREGGLISSQTQNLKDIQGKNQRP